MSTSVDYVTKFGSIPRLTHGSYLVWSNAIKFALMVLQGWRIVNGEEVESEIGVTQRSREAHESYQSKADKDTDQHHQHSKKA